jgi:hypothetical protein
VYTFVDKSHEMFHSTVFNSSNREAVDLIDGLINNYFVQCDIYLTNNHKSKHQGIEERIIEAGDEIGTAQKL